MSLQLCLVANEQEFELWVFMQRLIGRPHDDLGAEVAAHCINGNDRVCRHRQAGRQLIRPGVNVGLLVFVVDDFRLRDNLLATVETVGRYAMPQVGLTRGRVNRQSRFLYLVMPAARATR
jgi:hypothetical protein